MKRILTLLFSSRPLFGSKTSQSNESSAQSPSSTNHHLNQPDPSEQRSHDEENNPSPNLSLLQQVGNEINSTMAGRAISTMAKITSNKMSELLGTYQQENAWSISV